MSALSATTDTLTQKVHVTQAAGVCGGKPCIAGTRIRVWDIAVLTKMGNSPDDILGIYRQLSLSDIYAALAYYYDNKAAIDQQAAEAERLVEELRARTGPGPLEQLELEKQELQNRVTPGAA